MPLLIFTLDCILHRNLSAKCSNGDYLGQYARADKPPGEPLSALVAEDSSGFDSMDGATTKFLEAFGEALGSSSSNDSKFHDDCVDGELFVGYQLTYSSGSGILQIRFLCSDPSISSACGMLGFSFLSIRSYPNINSCFGTQSYTCNHSKY